MNSYVSWLTYMNSGVPRFQMHCHCMAPGPVVRQCDHCHNAGGGAAVSRTRTSAWGWPDTVTSIWGAAAGERYRSTIPREQPESPSSDRLRLSTAVTVTVTVNELELSFKSLARSSQPESARVSESLGKFAARWPGDSLSLSGSAT